MYIETWYKFKCDNCHTINWVNDGNVDDMTVDDVKGYICYKCKKEEFINIDLEDVFEDETGVDYLDIGLKSPT